MQKRCAAAPERAMIVLCRLIYAQLVTPHAERISDAIDVVEPCGYQCDLQNGLVIKPGGIEHIVIFLVNLSRIPGDSHDVVEHHAILVAYRRGCVVALQSFDQILIQSDSTQKLCVRFYSIDAPVRSRDDGCDHLVLPASQREIRGHQRPKSGKGMIERFGNQAV